MELKEYLSATFPGLILMPGLYDQWDTSIDFDLAKGLYQFKSDSGELNSLYFSRVYEQAISLFNDLFSTEDVILLVTNVYRYKVQKGQSRRKMKIYRHFVRNKEIRYQLKQAILPYTFDDEEDADGKYTAQFSLECSKQDIRYPLLLKAISNQDFPPLKPRLHNPYGLYAPQLFFINATKNIIFYMYDDRGCEVIAKDIETIRPIYEKYSNWVNYYCREEIDKRFK